jgi:hypothetical protein
MSQLSAVERQCAAAFRFSGAVPTYGADWFSGR